MPLIVTVGLDRDVQETLRIALEGKTRLVHYDMVPATSYSTAGRFRIESQRRAGQMLEPDGIVWHGYFDDPSTHAVRCSIAVSRVPTFPDLRLALAHDSRAVSLALATRAEAELGVPPTPHGYVPAKAEAALQGLWVAKFGNRHCGQDKLRSDILHDADAIVEPFFEGESIRVLFVGDAVWLLRYEAEGWIKNIGATVQEIPLDTPQYARVLQRARGMHAGLGLWLAGYDFIVPHNDAEPRFLEVNAYPSLTDAVAATAAFLDGVVEWVDRKVLGGVDRA